MGGGWLSGFEFTSEQRQQLLAIVGLSEDEGADLLDRMQFAIRDCQAICSPELPPAEMAERFRQMRFLARRLGAVWPTTSDCDRLLGHGFRGTAVPIRVRVSDTMIPIVDDIAIACDRALKALREIYGDPRRGRQPNGSVIGLAHHLSLVWKDDWGERAPRGRMLKALEYVTAVAGTTGDARRALEIVLPPAEKKRGKVRRTPARSRPRL